MFKNIRSKLTVLLSLGLLMGSAVAMPVLVHADNSDINSNLCAGANLALNAPSGTTCDASTKAGTDNLNTLVHTVINVFSLVVGIVSVIMIIVGGFRYVTSGGASDSVSGAKNTIIYAIIGLVVVALAQFIVQFVLSKVTNTSS